MNLIYSQNMKKEKSKLILPYWTGLNVHKRELIELNWKINLYVSVKWRKIYFK